MKMHKATGRSIQLPQAVVVLLFLLYVEPTSLGFNPGDDDGSIIKCIETERQALLMFKRGLVDDYGRLSSWGSEEDCCKWRGVHCSNRTGHVLMLDLHAPYSLRGILQRLRGNLSSSLLELQQLNYLNLNKNDFGGNPIPTFIGSLTKLKHLDLAEANFSGNIAHQLGNLSNLHYLDLNFNYLITIETLGWLSNLSSLTYLDMTNVNLGSAFDWLDAIKSLPFLSELRLMGCQLSQVKSPSLSLNINSSNSHLSTLDLSYNSLDSSMYNWLFNLTSSSSSSSLVDLYLSLEGNLLKGPIPDAFGNITSLSHLDLAGNQLQGVIPKSFGNLCNLKVLDLSRNNFSSMLPDFLHNLSRCNEVTLETLDLSGNQLTGSVPDFTRFSSLRDLFLGENRLTGFLRRGVMDLYGNQISGTLAGCSSLREIYLYQNQLDGPLPDFTGCSSLIVLNLVDNQLNGPLPDFTGCSSLRQLQLDHNQLNGTLTESIGQLSKLEFLGASYNSLQGVISDVHLLNLTKLKYLDLSFNSLAIELSLEWVSPFQLDIIKLMSCKLGPHFPKWLQTQRNFSYLDISNNGIAGTIPTWFWDLSPRLIFLNLSSNNISGTLPDLSSKFVLYPGIDLSSNHFEGPVPAFPSNITSLNLSKNKFSGTLSFLCSFTGWTLNYVDLSVNLFFGSLPICLTRWKSLVILDLAHNKLSGKIPSSLGSLFWLQTLVLRNNSFSGELPLSLRNSTTLRLIDLAVNKLSGKIPTWIGENLLQLNHLNLGSNKFHGSIPLNVCNLRYLRILDLSLNNISGSIPQCLSNFTAMAQKGISFEIMSIDYVSTFTNWDTRGSRGGFGSNHVDNALVGLKGSVYEYGRNLGLVKSIDLASNQLIGELPEGITSLLDLVALNLSRNKLHGIIPQNIGQLKSMESLDLSRNQFSGGIPASMSEISFLSYLDLSYNDLIGKIPSGTQLQGFDASAYVGNVGLCGPPLPLKCPGDETSEVPPSIGGDEDIQENGDEFWRWFYIGIAVGFTIGFWGVCGTLLLNRSWRHAYFLFLDNLKNWLYVTIAVHMAKLQWEF